MIKSVDGMGWMGIGRRGADGMGCYWGFMLMGWM